MKNHLSSFLSQISLFLFERFCYLIEENEANQERRNQKNFLEFFKTDFKKHLRRCSKSLGIFFLDAIVDVFALTFQLQSIAVFLLKVNKASLRFFVSDSKFFWQIWGYLHWDNSKEKKNDDNDQAVQRRVSRCGIGQLIPYDRGKFLKWRRRI